MYPFVVTIVYPVRTAASQAVKTGSNPVGDAKFIKAQFDRVLNYVPIALCGREEILRALFFVA